MITYINSSNANKYSSLFSEAEKALVTYWLNKGDVNPFDDDHFGAWDEENQSYEHGITSLNTYFSWIEDLLNIEGTTSLIPYTADGTKEEEEDEIFIDGMKFAILPIDEDVFEIDANTRRISVPQVFNTNGLSVQSDQISEVVYFKVNRYYDATDLYTQDIMIEWINAEKEDNKGYSTPVVKILDETGNYIIFGWALSNKLTQAAGTITFAVRFYTYDKVERKINYSLSTLTQTAKIMPNIDLDILKLLQENGKVSGYSVIDTDAETIRNRAVNSTAGDQGDSAADPVVIEEGYGFDPEGSGSANSKVVLLTEQADGTFIATVKGSGYTTDGGSISYSWIKCDYEDNHTDVANPVDYSVNWTVIELAEAKGLSEKYPSLLFYKKIDEKTYEPVEDLEALDAETSPTVCYKGSKCVFNGVGCYYFYIGNRKGKASASTLAGPFIVYPANTPQIIEAEDKVIFIDDENKNTITVEYKLNDDPDVKPGFIGASGDSTIYGYQDVTGTISAEYKFNKKDEVISFQWKDAKGNDIEGANEVSYVPTEEGEYTCTLVGSLNGDESDAVTTKAWTATYMPATPKLQVTGVNPVDGGEVSLSTGEEKSGDNYVNYIMRGGYKNSKIYLNVDYSSLLTNSLGATIDHPLCDKLIVQCYECVDIDSEGYPTVEAVKEALEGKHAPSVGSAFKKGDKLISETEVLVDNLSETKVKLAEYAAEKDGYYFWIVKNGYKGKDSTLVSSPIVYYDYNENQDV